VGKGFEDEFADNSDPAYNPSLPTVMKWNEIAGRITGDIVGFVDDFRLTGSSIENAGDGKL
jgi:hypothetical protein